MTQSCEGSHEASGLTAEQSGLILEGTIEAINSGFFSRYNDFLERAPAVLEDALEAGDPSDPKNPKTIALDSAYRTIAAEAPLGFILKPKQPLFKPPIYKLEVGKLDPTTGEVMFGTDFPVGAYIQHNLELVTTYCGFTAEDLAFAFQRVLEQEAAGIIIPALHDD